MPTIIGADNFSHRYFGNDTSLPSAAHRRIWSLVNRPAGLSFDSGKTRDGRGFMKIVEDGVTATQGRKGIVAGNRVLVSSFYFIVDAAPSVESLMAWGQGPASACSLLMTTAGEIKYRIGGGGGVTLPGNVADGNIHRVDLRMDTSSTTFVMDCTLDSLPGSQLSLGGLTATDITDIVIGSFTPTHTLTFWVQDLVWSVTSGDHSIGEHVVHSVYPNGDGTHAPTITAGDFNDGAGGDILTSTTDAWTEIDDWATDVADTATYVQDTAGASTEYTEHTFGDTAVTTIWGVFGYAACFASSTTLCSLTVRVVDSTDATLTDILADEDVSETALRYWAMPITGPGGNWDQDEVSGAKARIGLSTNTGTLPRCSALMLQVVGLPPPPPEGESFPARRSVIG
jgi:hypothetical protein